MGLIVAMIVKRTSSLFSIWEELGERKFFLEAGTVNSKLERVQKNVPRKPENGSNFLSDKKSTRIHKKHNHLIRYLTLS